MANKHGETVGLISREGSTNKPRGDTSKLIRMTDTSAAAEEVGELGASPMLVGMQTGTAALENSLAVLYKVKHTLTVQPSDPTSWYLSKKKKNYVPQKPVHECLR